MADSKISALTNLSSSSIANDDLLPIVDMSAGAGGSKRITFQDLIDYVLPAGMLSAYAGTSAPSGWLFCSGQNVSRTTYSRLFTAVSTTWGSGDGSGTFGIPDLRGRFVMGAGSGTGMGNYGVGTSGGSESRILTTNEMPAHTHTVASMPQSYTGYGQTTPIAGVAVAVTATVTTSSAGGGSGFSIVSPYLSSNFIIKY